MSRLLYQAELHRQDDRAARSRDRTGWSQSPFTESNRRPSPYHGDALPTELKGRARRAVGDSTRRSRPSRGGGLTDAPGSGPDEQPAVRGARRRRADARPGQEPALQPVVGERPADQEALQLVAPHLRQEVAGQLVLDALGHDAQAEVVRQ